MLTTLLLLDRFSTCFASISTLLSDTKRGGREGVSVQGPRRMDRVKDSVRVKVRV